ncbi:MAG: tetratricopeptide repeat protein [Deltaproteobacteria bacterium]|nr:tetratricopeptide repeat protein [Deltaproteobacteria bacterium]
MKNSHDLYDQILNSAPSQKTLILILTKLKEEGDIDRVIQECLKALAIYPNDITIRRLLAESYLETSQVSNAEMELKKAVGLISDLADVYKLQAEICGKQGRKSEAIEALRIYLAYHPQDEDALRLYDDLKPEKERSAGELQSYSNEIHATFGEDMGKKSPEFITATLAELYFDQGELQKAIDTYRNLVALNPEDPHFRDRLEALEAIPQEESQGDQEIRDMRVAGTQRVIAILESWRSNIREHVNPTYERPLPWS